jgi:hypothetical protein
VEKLNEVNGLHGRVRTAELEAALRTADCDALEAELRAAGLAPPERLALREPGAPAGSAAEDAEADLGTGAEESAEAPAGTPLHEAAPIGDPRELGDDSRNGSQGHQPATAGGRLLAAMLDGDRSSADRRGDGEEGGRDGSVPAPPPGTPPALAEVRGPRAPRAECGGARAVQYALTSVCLSLALAGGPGTRTRRR